MSAAIRKLTFFPIHRVILLNICCTFVCIIIINICSFLVELLQREEITIFRVLIEQWIRAKYEREEFCHPERQSYLSGTMEGFLMKRGKEDSRYQLRKFVLSENEDTLK